MNMQQLLRGAILGAIFLLPFIPLFVANSLFFPFITGKNFSFRIGVEIMFAAWVLLMFYNSQYRPKFSGFMVAILSLLGIMGLAAIFGESPWKSFWSNFERMEGYITLLHLGAYFLVASSVLTTEKLWNRFFNTTVLVSAIIILYSFAQLSGSITINQGGVRVDATFGNAAYLAIYMLIHAFITAFLFFRWRGNQMVKWAYGALMAGQVFILFSTATRGTILAITGGALVSTFFVALFGKNQEGYRKAAAGALIALILLVIGFIAVKDTSFVREHQVLGRIATISLSEAGTRFTIWNMGYEGFKERPLIGWGQGNFNFVFNTYYSPELYNDEPWFDRVHNIFFDWLVTGGVLGLVAYLSLYVIALWYMWGRALFKGETENALSVVDRSLITGLLAGYFFHNIFVFDNIVSYIFFFSILAFLHQAYGREYSWFGFKDRVFDAGIVTRIGVPIMLVILVFGIYVLNVKPILASQDLINAFRNANNPAVQLQYFRSALERDTVGKQEIREQLATVAMNIARNNQIPADVREQFRVTAEDELTKQIEAVPNDARTRVFFGAFYRFIGERDKAIEQLLTAHELSPNKQTIMQELALVYIDENRYEEARAIMQKAYELAPRFYQVRELYAVTNIYTGNNELAEELVGDDPELQELFLRNNFALQAYYATQQYDKAIEFLDYRVAQNPTDLQTHVSRSVLYYESGQEERAVEALQETINLFPNFKTQGERFIADIRAGRAPGTGGQQAPSAGPQRQ